MQDRRNWFLLIKTGLKRTGGDLDCIHLNKLMQHKFSQARDFLWISFLGCLGDFLVSEDIGSSPGLGSVQLAHRQHPSQSYISSRYCKVCVGSAKRASEKSFPKGCLWYKLKDTAKQCVWDFSSCPGEPMCQSYDQNICKQFSIHAFQYKHVS